MITSKSPKRITIKSKPRELNVNGKRKPLSAEDVVFSRAMRVYLRSVGTKEKLRRYLELHGARAFVMDYLSKKFKKV